MGEESLNSNKKSLILVTRNTPVAVVVGAAGFIGSNLVEGLLKRGIQVIGVDDFSSGQRKNIEEASKNKHFHLIAASADNLEIEPERIDYIFIAAGAGWNISYILRLAKKYNSRIVFLSSIELYDKANEGDWSWFKSTEEKIARFSEEEGLNARIVRLSAVFGPRMNFQISDPAIRLIQAALKDELQKESVALDFSSRAIFIEDAIKLIVKSMLSGATARKIYDGVRLYPIKAAEIKQVLLDPLWHEKRNFEPSELPPWPTPNLEKTMKELSWKVEVRLVQGLKETLSYFKDNEIKVPELKVEQKVYQKKISPWVDLEEGGTKLKVKEEKKKEKEGSGKRKFFKPNLFVAVGGLIIFYAFFYPLVAFGWGVFNLRSNLNQAIDYLSKGQYDKSRQSVLSAKAGMEELKTALDGLQVVRKSGLFGDQFRGAERAVELTDLMTSSAVHAINGTEQLGSSLKSITGESSTSAKESLALSQVEFDQAYEDAGRTEVDFQNGDLNALVPFFFKDHFSSLHKRFSQYNTLLEKGRLATLLLPELVGVDGKKSYLVILQNNNELRPTGGVISSFAQVDFEGGKLKKIEASDTSTIDGKLPFHVEPPKEIKEDLGQKDWYLRDANWEADYPTAARQIEWFYNQETAKRLDGVIAMDLSAVEELLSVVGSLQVNDYGEQVTADNLFTKAIAHTEQSFTPGAQVKKSFLTALTNELFNKLFFLPNQNWSGIVSSLGRSLEGKHLLLYFGDRKIFAYLAAEDWVGAIPRQPAASNSLNLEDFLAPVEANLGVNQVNYYLERAYHLQTMVGKEGQITNRLKIDYTNRSPSDIWPGGSYKNRIRLLLPFGTKLNRASWGESDITSQLSTFSDYGRTSFSVLLNLAPSEHKALFLEYQLQTPLNFNGDVANYRLDVIKQPGTNKDRFDWQLSYPLNYRLIGDSSSKLAPQEYNLSTDLSSDRSFSVSFKR